MNENTASIIKTIDELIKELSTSTTPLPDGTLEFISRLTDEVTYLQQAKESRKTDQLTKRLDTILTSITENKEVSQKTMDDAMLALERIKVESPTVNVNVPDVIVPEIKIPEINVPDVKIPDIKVTVPDVIVPEIKIPEINVPPVDISKLSALIEQLLKTPPSIEFPKKASDPLAVRLSDGQAFYRSMGSVAQAMSQVAVKEAVNDIDDASTQAVTFIGKEDANSEWSIMRIDENNSYPIFTYASIINNGQITSYAVAWSNRGDLNYGTFAQSKRSTI